jgi:hypothetical protein
VEKKDEEEEDVAEKKWEWVLIGRNSPQKSLAVVPASKYEQT